MIQNAESIRFNFDAWARLAQEDPAGFEARRREALEEAVRQAPAGRRHRLRGLQWRIDQVREQAGTPLAACLKISDMMWNTVVGPDGLIDNLRMLSQGRPRESSPEGSGVVVPFRSHSSPAD